MDSLVLLNTTNRALNIELLRTFHMASALGTLRAAADRRHCTLGAVSQQIKRLEQQLDRQLLVRFKTGVQLTPEGEQLVAQSANLLGEHDALLDRLSSQSTEGVVRLGLPEEYVPQLLDHLLPALRQTVPKVRLRVQTANSGELRRAVTQGELELAIVIGRASDQPATAVSLWQTRPVWAGSSLDQPFHGEPLPLALHPPECPYRALGLAALEAAGRAWETIFASSSVVAVESAVANGLAVSVLNRARVSPAMQVLGPNQGLPALSECFAYLVETSQVSTRDRQAVAVVKERLQAPYLTQLMKQGG